jgi:2-methylcitrate dehydratase PrpD
MQSHTDPLELLGRTAAGLKLDTLPEEIVHCAKQRVLDTLGCLVAGYESGIASEIRQYLAAQGGRPEATLLPGGQKTTIVHAVLAHATYIHGLELSDAAPRGTVHPGNEIVPITLAYAEKLGVGGPAIIPALVAGYEVEIRFGRAIFPNAFYRGWWTPGMLGGIGAAVAAASMLRLDTVKMANTIGNVLNLMPTAVKQANEEGRSIKWLIGGQACAAGVMAAEMAARGVEGMREIVEGWLAVVADEVHAGRLTAGIDATQCAIDQWELASGILTKHYATVGPLTAALDATFDLIAKHAIAADAVVEIHIDATKRTALHDTLYPDNEIAARASLPYCLAVALCKRDPALLLGPAFRPEVLADEAIQHAAAKVRITQNDDYERQYPARSLARVTITMKNGKSFTQEEDRSARSRYLNPTDEDIERKFRGIATPVLGQPNTDKVVGLVAKLEALSNIGELIEALASDGAVAT